MPFGGALTAILSAAGPIVGSLLNGGAQSGNNEIIQNLIKQFGVMQGQGQTAALGTGNGQGGLFGPLNDLVQSNLDRSNQSIYGNAQDPGALANLQNRNASTYDPQGLLQTLMGGSYDPYGQNIPGVQQNLSDMGGLLPGAQGQTDLARQVFAGGGWTPQSQQSFDNLSGLMYGQGSQQQGLNNMANNIFGSNGQSQNPLWTSIMNAAAQGMTGTNPALQYAQRGAENIFNQQGQTGPTNQGIDAASGMYANGGMTPALNQLQGTGFNVLGNNGLTPTGTQGENAALQVLNTQGQTPTTQGLQNRGLDLANRESLLPMDLVASMAHDRASTDYANNAQAATRQALARGGGPGATVANGLQNQGLADYADKGSQAEAKAVQDALVQQQQLQLQQAGMGANMAEQGGALQNNRFGTAASTLTGLENVAANRFGLGGNFIQGATQAGTNRASTGLSALDQLAALQSGRQMGALGDIPGISQTGINQANVFGNLGLGGNQQNLQALQQGTGMYNDVLNSELGANNQYNSLIGTQGNYALGAGGLANNSQNSMQSLLSAILGGNMGAANAGLTRGLDYLGQNQQGIQNSQNMLNFMGGQQQNNQASGNALLAQMLGLDMGSMTGISNMFGPAGNNTNQNPYAGLFSSIISGAGNLVNKIPTGGVGTNQTGSNVGSGEVP